jgi:hypothetical protein
MNEQAASSVDEWIGIYTVTELSNLRLGFWVVQNEETTIRNSRKAECVSDQNRARNKRGWPGTANSTRLFVEFQFKNVNYENANSSFLIRHLKH